MAFSSQNKRIGVWSFFLKKGRFPQFHFQRKLAERKFLAGLVSVSLQGYSRIATRSFRRRLLEKIPSDSRLKRYCMGPLLLYPAFLGLSISFEIGSSRLLPGILADFPSFSAFSILTDQKTLSSLG